MIRIAILGSGSGSNAKNLLNYFQNNNEIQIILIGYNKPNIGIIQHGKDYNIPLYFLTKENFILSDQFIQHLLNKKVDWIILAGFLWKIPVELCKKFENKIINIHPSILPKYGGKGMYGHFIHQAVFNNKEKESGITIHLVNEEYDKGEILFQDKIKINKKDNPNTIEQKVRSLEIKHFPNIIEKVLLNR
jgi:phosphoribosylglycinamide formyltransferase-1